MKVVFNQQRSPPCTAQAAVLCLRVCFTIRPLLSFENAGKGSRDDLVRALFDENKTFQIVAPR